MQQNGHNDSLMIIGQQQSDNDIFQKETSSINIVHTQKYSNSKIHQQGKVTMCKQKTTTSQHTASHRFKTFNRQKYQLDKQSKWVEKQYQQFQKGDRNYKHPNYNRHNLNTNKQTKTRYHQQTYKNRNQKSKRFIEKQAAQSYTHKIDIPHTQTAVNSVPQWKDHLLNVKTSAQADESVNKKQTSCISSQNISCQIKQKDDNFILQTSQNICEEPIQTKIQQQNSTNQSEFIEIQSIEINFTPCPASKTSDKHKNRNQQVILNQKALQYSQRCQEQSSLREDNQLEDKHLSPEQIINQILQNNQSSMKSWQIQFCCSCNHHISEVKICNVQLTALKLSVCLQQKAHRILIRSCVAEETIWKYVQFQQIRHSLPQDYGSSCKYYSYTLCKILSVQLELQRCQPALQVQALILKCFCGAKNFCLMNQYESLPLSCRKCSSSLQIRITKLQMIDS